MVAASFIDLRINNAEQFKESLSEPAPNTSLYLVYGKTEAWSNESSPNIANTSIATIYEVWSNMIAGKKVLGGDIHHVIPRNNWTANTIYTAYDDKSTTLFNDNVTFYVVNSDLSVYKCIANNISSNSTVEPTSVNPAITSKTSDGYSWKYMYTITDAEEIRFTTDNYIPVKTLSTDDGSIQWQVESIILTNAGVGYTNSTNIVVSVSGDGTTFAATGIVNTSTNTITSITVTSPGVGYTYATVTISDLGLLGSGATARAIISPPGGHGSDPLYELGGKNVMINSKFVYDENLVFPITNDFRQIALVKDPYLNSTSNVATNTTFIQAMSMITSGIGSYIDDEIIYQGLSLSAFTFKGRVVSWDNTTGKIILINTVGTPTAASALVGVTSSTSRVISSIVENAFEPYSGRILYVDNIKPVTRSSDQIEDFRILVTF